MACIIHLETSTEACSVALSEDGACLYSKENFEGPSHSVSLGVFIDEVLSMADSAGKKLDAVALSCGPGSYTGLRIGSSMAKGICYGRDLPLITLPTLKVMSVPILLSDDLPQDAFLCPMIDARRMEVYTAIYDRALSEKKTVCAEVVTSNSFDEYLDMGPVYFFGNGAAKCRDVIIHPNAHFVDDIKPLAKWMFPLAEKKFYSGEFENVAYFEPFYLKDFVAGKPRNLLFEDSGQ